MRYNNRKVLYNDLDQYSKIREDRGVKIIVQYDAAKLKHPTAQQIANLDLIDETWKTGSRYWKYAEKYYGDSKLWWVIAWFNRTPIEGDLSFGDTIQIPLPLDLTLVYMGF